MFVGESGVSRVIQRTCQVMNELKTDDPKKLRAAGVIDLPTLQRYLNFHYSVTIDLFGADESSNAATFYSTGLKGRFEEGKRIDDHQLRGQSYKVLQAVNGQLSEREVPMLNALNEVLRDDYIKDSMAGVGRWNKVIEKAGIPFRLHGAAQGLPPQHRRPGRREGLARRPRRQRSRVERQGRRMAAYARRPCLRRQPHGPRRGAGQIRQLDRAAGDGHQPPAGQLRVRPLRLSAERCAQTAMDAPSDARSFIKQHLIDPEICIRCNTCEATCPVSAITHDSNNYVVDAGKCNLCMACISPCPTGSIDNWRTMPKAKAYSIEEQFGWESLPAELSEAELGGRGVAARTPPPSQQPAAAPAPRHRTGRDDVPQRRLRRHGAAVVRSACLHQPLRPEARPRR